MDKMQSKIISILKERYNNLIKYTTDDKVISFFRGKTSGSPESLKYNDSLWEKVTLPYEWDTSEDVWFRKKIVVPREIKGISIKGSKLEICGPDYFAGSIMTSTHGELYIDGKKIFEERNWTDLRYRNEVSDKVNVGEVHSIVLHFFKREDYVDLYPRRLSVLETHYSYLDDIAFEIESFIEEINFAQSLPGTSDILTEIFNELEIEELENIEISKLLDLLDYLRNKLSFLKPLAKKREVHLIGHAHIDLNWLWEMDETEEICRNTFNTVIKLMEKYPDLCFSQSQAFIYKLVEEKYPDLFEEIKKRVAEGRWEITASSWVELDLNMANGEAIIRQILYAKKYIKEKFNFEPEVFWSPDTYGHPWTIPQILKKSGLNYYYFMRSSKKEYDLFRWKGPDGSEVVAFNSNYLGKIDTHSLCELVKYTGKIQHTNTSMYVYGIGDHGGGPTVEDINVATKLESRSLFPKLMFSTAHNYFKIVSRQKNIDIPIIEDEFNTIQDGTYTTHWDTKIHNRNCERLMLETEILGALAMILYLKYPDLEDLWKITLFNQFHDILPGEAIKPSYNFSNAQAEKVEKITKDEICNIIKHFSGKVKINSQGIPFIVFNCLSWERTDVVKIKLPRIFPKNPSIKDEDGNIYPVQILDDEMVFIAEGVPSLGYKVFYLIERSADDTLIMTDPLVLENEFFILKVDDETGIISYLYDKKNDKVVMKKRRDEGLNAENAFPMKIKNLEPNIPLTAVMMNNMLQVLFEEAHPLSAEVIGPISKIINLIKKPDIEILSKGPVAGIIRIKNKFNKSTIIQDVTVYRKLERIDFNTYINWQEKSGPNIEAPMLKASFTPILGSTKAIFEIPFGSIERVADGREFPALNWVDISDKGYGLSILSDTKYGFDIKGNTICITLIRTSSEADPDPDRGEHSFTYSAYPHKGDFKVADSVRKGYEINHKLIAYFMEETGGNDLPIKKSFIGIDSPEVILTCFKKAENSDDLILRVYESKGKKVKTTVSFGFDIKKIQEVDLIENPINGKDIIFDKDLTFTIDPFEIKTFRLKFKKTLNIKF